MCIAFFKILMLGWEKSRKGGLLREYIKNRKTGSHLILGCLFLLFGIIAVICRSILSGGELVDFLTNTVGTITWAGLVTVIFSYLLFRTYKWRMWVLLTSLLFCFGMEFLQMTSLPAFMSQKFPIARLIFGSTYSTSDLPFYFVGVFVAWLALQTTRSKCL